MLKAARARWEDPDRAVRAANLARVLRAFCVHALLSSWIVLAGCAAREPATTTPSPATPRRDSGPVARPPLAGSVHVRLGVPHDADPSDEVLLDRREYVLSYSPARNAANWVAWRITQDDLGDWDRQNDFRADPDLPPGSTKIGPRAFARSGFDRGHLCPSADRTRSAEANSATFLMSNMHPQRPELNRGPWEKLESLERAFARLGGGEVYVVAGGIWDARPERVGEVAIPSAEFKIAVVLRPGQGPRDVDAQATVIAVSMPNDASVEGRSPAEFATTVDAIEAATGYDFLSDLDDATETVLEARDDRDAWAQPRER